MRDVLYERFLYCYKGCWGKFSVFSIGGHSMGGSQLPEVIADGGSTLLETTTLC